MSEINCPNLVLCFLFCIVSSNDYAQKWAKKNALTTADLKGICLVNHDTGFVFDPFHTIRKTTDNGLTWQCRQIKYTKINHDLTSLPAGVYSLRLTADKTVQVGKFVKQ